MRLVQHIEDDLGFNWPLWLGAALFILGLAITVALCQ